MSDSEFRIGIVPIETLLAERQEMVTKVAPLRAMHGSFGTWEALRKIELSRAAMMARAKAVADGQKITEAAIDALAHTADGYVEFVTKGTYEKAEWAVLEDRIQGINDAINRGQAIARYLSAEVGLARG